jgi:transcriptional regulator with XRE-family HTH domain
MAKRSIENTRRSEPDPNDIVGVFGTRLKAARVKLGVTQTQLAERAGLVQQYVSLIETGQQNITLTTAQTLAQVVHQDLSDMLRGIRPRRRRT